VAEAHLDDSHRLVVQIGLTDQAPDLGDEHGPGDKQSKNTGNGLPTEDSGTGSDA
jgi:hypothetical protein